MFTPEQPDLNWRNPEVPVEFEKVLRFWLDRGVDGFRIDVAAGLFKHPELPDSPDPEADERTRDSVNPLAWNQPEVHEVWRSWRAICEEYTALDGRQRLLVGEASVPTPAEQAMYVRGGRAAPGVLLPPAARAVGRRALPPGDRRGGAGHHRDRVDRHLGAQQPRPGPHHDAASAAPSGPGPPRC
ncbi:alpha-amylase family glycosyl hydrolase [Kitasatospora fiedleri]